MLRLALMGSFLFASTGFAALKKEAAEYSAGASNMEGYVSYEAGGSKIKPGILIVPNWMGLAPSTKDKADQLAKMGYVAMAVDVYGKGLNPQSAEEAGALAGKYKKDIPLLRAHMRAAYEKLLSMKNVDPKKIIVIGYCFGGTAALELARSGATLAGVATFHAGLASSNPADAKNIKEPVLVMHGADDPHVKPEEVAAFKKEMADAGVNLTFISYPGAVHSFTDKGAGTDNSKGSAYNAEADKKSWREFTRFLKRIK